MKLEFTYSPEDFVEGFCAKIHDPTYRAPFSQNKSVQLILCSVFVSFFGWVTWWRWRSSSTPFAPPWSPHSDFAWDVAIPFCIAAVVAFLAIYAMFAPVDKRKLRRILHRHPSLQQPQTLTVDETGIGVLNPLWSGQFNWAAFRGWAETENLFVALTSDRGRLIIPKRCASGEVVTELRQMMAARIVGGAGGFPVVQKA
ncbi:MAG TPA: YcxB family protein [Tepidisphaeraceae bacterium]